MKSPQPAYLRLQQDGKLAQRIDAARAKLRECDLCPRRCGVDRLAGELGFCQTTERAWVASFTPHLGEEAPLVGRNGSGTIFSPTATWAVYSARITISATSRRGSR